MSLTKWNSDDLFPTFDSIWDDFFSRTSFARSMDLGTTIPAANMKETDEAYLLEVAIPGMKKDDFDIDLDNNVLTISSESKEEKEEKDGEKVTRREFSYSSFKRSFQIPQNVKKEEVEAEYADGLLKLSIPKSTKETVDSSQKINVK